MRRVDPLSTILRFAGACAGGAAGYWVFQLILQQGLYALVIPGALLGLGAGLGATRYSRIEGVLCGIAAVGLGIYLEWKTFPFVADESFSYFLGHLHQLKALTIVMIVIGGLIGFSWGKEAHNPLKRISLGRSDSNLSSS